MESFESNMKITTISYGLTINTGNFTSVRIDMTAEVEDHSPVEAMNALKTAVQFEAAKVQPVKGQYISYPK
jgi:hypothetical protein